MNERIRQLVQKVWSFCDVLRDDGITYQDYVEELSWLMFLCICDRSQNGAAQRIPKGCRWSDLTATADESKLHFYNDLLSNLADARDSLTREIFGGARTSIRRASVLARLVDMIDAIEWQTLGNQALGDVYEGLLEKNATEQRSGAGQYFTPRFLVDMIVRVVDPKPGELVQDPAAGTGGFLVAASRHVGALEQGVGVAGGRRAKFVGVELVQSAYRLCLMNLFLHQVNSKVVLGDTLTSVGVTLAQADVILSNPPFGSKRGAGVIDRPDFKYGTSNKQFAFLQHIYRSLRPGGRAAVIVPDGVLFEDGTGRDIRRELMDMSGQLSVLRLPTGIFYAQGVKTNVLFFRRRRDDRDDLGHVWVYDARSGVNPKNAHSVLIDLLSEFEADHATVAAGGDTSSREGADRSKRFTREEVSAHGDRLDLEVSIPRIDLPSVSEVDPGDLLKEVQMKLNSAVSGIDELWRILQQESR